MSRLVNIEDYRRSAGRRLPKIIFDYLEGGALDEQTLRANAEDLQRLRLRQSIMRDVSSVDLTSTVLEYTIRTPVMISPMGLLTLFCRDADVAMARAAQDAGRSSFTARGRERRCGRSRQPLLDPSGHS